MNRKMYNWISELLRNKPEQPTTRVWSEIGNAVIDLYQCGRLQNDKLFFSVQDKFSLRSHIKNELGIDPFEIHQLPDTRIEVAEHHDNEKLARNPVSHDFILINCPIGILNLNGQQIQLHNNAIQSAGMMCLSSKIEQFDHSTIVVVENLSIMPLCSALSIPPQIKNALWIYRGDHKTGAKIAACNDLLKRHGNKKSVIVFSDMDPKGLEIALTTPHANEWLGPKKTEWDQCLRSRLASRKGYDTQGEALKYLIKYGESNRLSYDFNNLITKMREERSSYRQEHMYIHKIPLDLFSLR